MHTSSPLKCALFTLIICFQQSAFANNSFVSYVFSPQSPIESLLIGKPGTQKTLNKVKRFTQNNFQLDKKIVFSFQNSVFPYSSGLINVENEVHLTQIPFSFLYQAYRQLESQYPQQPVIQDKIYGVIIETLLWSELGKAISHHSDVEDRSSLVDQFDTFAYLMLLNQNREESDYLLDAIEIYLKTDQLSVSLTDLDEVQSDEQRYRKAVCLILGKDYSNRIKERKEPYIKLINELAWGQRKILACHKQYESAIETWLTKLKPYLTPDSTIELRFDHSKELISEKLN